MSITSHCSDPIPDRRNLKEEKFGLTDTLEGTMVARVTLIVAMEACSTA